MQGWRACSGKDTAFPGKPRSPDECLHVHDSYLARLLPKSGRRRKGDQSIANATTISPNKPTAMIVLVVVSIVGSVD